MPQALRADSQPQLVPAMHPCLTDMLGSDSTLSDSTSKCYQTGLGRVLTALCPINRGGLPGVLGDGSGPGEAGRELGYGRRIRPGEDSSVSIPSQVPDQGIVRSQDSTERSWFKVSRFCYTLMKYSCDRRP